MSICPEHDRRAAMTDDEFWSHVFSWRDDDAGHWAAYDEDVYAIDCARCGRTVEVNPDGRERDAFCDDCADEMQPDDEEDDT